MRQSNGFEYYRSINGNKTCQKPVNCVRETESEVIEKTIRDNCPTRNKTDIVRNVETGIITPNNLVDHVLVH